MRAAAEIAAAAASAAAAMLERCGSSLLSVHAEALACGSAMAHAGFRAAACVVVVVAVVVEVAFEGVANTQTRYLAAQQRQVQVVIG